MIPARCGATITQPVWPVQCITSSAASFSGRYGSPPFPKMPSTKSRLLTRLPGAKKRISIVFWGSRSGRRDKPSAAAAATQTSRTGSLWSAANGSAITPCGRLERRRQQRGERFLRHRLLVRRNRQVRLRRCEKCLAWCAGRSWDCAEFPAARGRTADTARQRCRRSCGSDITRASPGRSSRNVFAGQPRRSARAYVFQVIVQKRLNPPVRGTQQIPEHQVLLVIVAKQRTRDFEKVAVREAVCRLAQRGQFQPDIAHNLDRGCRGRRPVFGRRIGGSAIGCLSHSE